MNIDPVTAQEIVSRGEHTMREINDRIRSLIDCAPSDAGAELVVHKTPVGYKGLLKIHSRHRRFVGGDSGPEFQEVLDRIFEEVREQIEDWKRDRDLDIGAV